MSQYIYEVCLEGGRSHPEHSTFYKNVVGLRAKSPDRAGINNMCIISHHLDSSTIHMLCSEGIKNERDVTVEEITKETLNDDSSHHGIHTQLIKNYFLPYGTYPNIE